jgi:molybdopterin-guanine dinucleotide biosynthesis protein A
VVTSIVLAGGGSSRLGGIKAMQIVGGKSLLQRVVERVALVSDQILVIGSVYQPGFPTDPRVQYKEDLYPGKGPLGGIYTGLLASKSVYNVVVACDMPFLNVELLRYMIKLSPGFDAVVPRVGKVQPLHAVYSRACVDTMGVQVKDNRVKITWFLDDVHVRYIEQAECQDFDPRLLSFFNVNSQADLARANTLIEENTGLGNRDKL